MLCFCSFSSSADAHQKVERTMENMRGLKDSLKMQAPKPLMKQSALESLLRRVCRASVDIDEDKGGSAFLRSMIELYEQQVEREEALEQLRSQAVVLADINKTFLVERPGSGAGKRVLDVDALEKQAEVVLAACKRVKTLRPWDAR